MNKTRKYWMEIIALSIVVVFWSGVYLVQQSQSQNPNDPAFQRQVQEEINQD